MIIRTILVCSNWGQEKGQNKNVIVRGQVAILSYEWQEYERKYPTS